MDISSTWALLHNALGQAQAQAGAAVSGTDIKVAVSLIAAGLCMGIGALGSGLSEGFAAAKAVEGIARNPEAAPTIMRTMIIGQAVTESVAIYAFVISLLLLFVS